MTFLGRKRHPRFAGEVGNDCRRRWPGARVRHRMKENGIKMYDKHGCVLRVETTINRPSEFQVRRRGIHHGHAILTMALRLHDHHYPQARIDQAA